MISKPPLTSEKNLNAWLQELQYLFNNTIKILDIPVSKSGIASNYVHGKHPTRQLTVGNSAYFGFILPNELEQIKEVTIRFIPTTTGTIDYTVNLSYGGVGEDENANTQTVTVAGKAVTDDLITEIDITSLFSAVDNDDQIGAELVLDAAATTTDIEVLSLYLKYI